MEHACKAQTETNDTRVSSETMDGLVLRSCEGSCEHSGGVRDPPARQASTASGLRDVIIMLG